ncbi:hypothetical protein [Actinomadura sp. 3N508]|uniref:hypothetical protein n=1 Tax=Actinomadura sp. 3N508 TaxID=3375153 RepID=UPI00379C6E57
MISELEEQNALALEAHQAFSAASASCGAGPVLPPYLVRLGFDDRLRVEVAAAVHGSRRRDGSGYGGWCLTGRHGRSQIGFPDELFEAMGLERDRAGLHRVLRCQEAGICTDRPPKPCGCMFATPRLGDAPLPGYSPLTKNITLSPALF